MTATETPLPRPDEVPLFDRRLKEERDYWVARLTPAPQPVVPIPELRAASGAAGREPPAPATSAIVLDWPAELGAELRRLARGSPWLVYVALAAALEACLHRLSGERSVAIGSPSLQRSQPDGAAGAANAIVVVDAIDPERSFRAHLLQVRETLLGAYDRQGYPFARLLEDLRLARQDGRCPLFDAMLSLAGLHDDPPEVGQGLTLRFALRAQGLSGRAQYDRRRFDRASVARFVAHLGGLLSAALARLDAPLAALDLLSAAERHQLLWEWNDTARGRDGEAAGLYERIAAQAAAAPEAIAVVADGEAGQQRLSYGELLARAERLATRLRRLRVGPEVAVGVLAERSLAMVEGIVGTLAAGGAYVPLEPDQPAERLAGMLADAAAPVLLCEERLRDLLALPDGVARVSLDGPGCGAAAATGGRRAVTAGGAAAAGARAWDDTPVYVIFTSGSTGRPKGAANTQAGVRNRLLWMQETYRLGAEDAVLQKTPFGFDVSVWEFLWPLLVGARLVLARPGGHRDPPYLRRLIAREGVTTLHFVPSVLRLFLDQEELGECVSVRYLLASGEALPAELARRCGERLPWVGLHNLYGPTEAAIDVSAWPCRPEAPREPVPIGRPIANLRLRVLDRELRPVPLGVAGELYIGGVGLARGYWRRPELTAERFVPEPLGETPGARLYRTGDLARFRPGGELEYLGRVDFQVKVRGVRIELGEIEAALSQHPALRQSVVTARQHPAGGGPYLVAYVVATAEPAPTATELRTWLLAKLPEAMVPAVFVPLAALPLTPRGKVDRRALPAPGGVRPDLGAAYVAPRNAAEQVVAALWAELLGLERVGARDSFFDLGGHSLLATRLVARLQRVFQVELPLLGLFERPTVEGVLAQIAGLSGGAEVAEETARLFLAASELPAAERAPGFERLLRDRGLDLPAAQEIPRCAESEAAPLSLSQEGLWFGEQLAGDGAAYNLTVAVRLAVPLDLGRFQSAVDEIVRRHEALRTTFRVEGGVPVQVVAPARRLAVTLVELGALPAAARQSELRALAQDAARRRFDLTRGPLLRVDLARLADADFVLLLTMHHIVSDGWSMAIFVGELAALYGAGAELPPLRVQYRDFARWQRRWLSGSVLEAQLAYWRRQLAGSPARLRLPTDRLRPAVATTRGGALPFQVAAALTASLRALGRQEGATLFMVLLAGFKVMLRAYAGQDDVAVGTYFANRARREVEGLIGFFVNTLVLRTHLGGDPTCRELLARVRRTTLGAYAHQDLPFSKLVEALSPRRDPSHNPLFQVVLSLDNFPPPQTGAGLAVEPVPLATGTAKFDLALEMKETGEALAGLLEWNADLFLPATAGRMLAHYRTILQWMVDAPDDPLSSLSLAGGAVGAAAARDFNADLDGAA